MLGVFADVNCNAHEIVFYWSGQHSNWKSGMVSDPKAMCFSSRSVEVNPSVDLHIHICGLINIQRTGILYFSFKNNIF